MTARKLMLAILFATSPAFGQDAWLFLQADRLEFVEHSEEWLWDAQGWYGHDEHKLWWKTEGEFDSDDTHDAEIQLLYSRPVSAYWDLQFGLRQDFEPETGVHAVVGLQGLAPQWFEIDVAAFLHENGDLSARFEAEYDLLLTQRLVLQPRLEFDTGPESIALDLRLRYEIRREIAPYIGISWQDASGGSDFTSFVAGARFWY